MPEASPTPPFTSPSSNSLADPLSVLALELMTSLSRPQAETRTLPKCHLSQSPPDPTLESINPALNTLNLHLNLDPKPSIPSTLFSLQTYEYCGFTLSAASTFWRLNQAALIDLDTNLDEDPDSREYFQSFPFFRIDQVREPSGDAFRDDDEWRWALCEMGFEIWARDAIMREEFKELRRTEGVGCWAKDIVDARLRGLEEGRMRLEADRSVQREGSENQSRIPGMAAETTREAKEDAPPGSIVLWKSLPRYRTHDLFNPEGTVQRFSALLNSAYYGLARSSCWFVDKEIPMRYLQWAKYKDPIGESVLLRLQVDKNLIEALKAPVLKWQSRLWKRFLFSCRRWNVPEELDYLWHETLVIEHVGTSVAAVVDWREMGLRNALRRKEDGGIATQYVFSDCEGLDFLQEHCSRSLVMYRFEE